MAPPRAGRDPLLRLQILPGARSAAPPPQTPFAISAISGKGMQEVLRALAEIIETSKAENPDLPSAESGVNFNRKAKMAPMADDDDAWDEDDDDL